jgi:hypothetical protein
MAWLIHSHMNARVGGELRPAGVPFEAPAELAKRLKAAGFETMTKAKAERLIAGEPEPDPDDGDDGKE